MFHRLQKLKEKGYSPSIIFDIGAHHGNWTKDMLKIFANPKYYLFEAIQYSELNQHSGHPNIQVFNTILNDTSKEVDWYEMKNTGDSMFREKTHFFNNCNVVKRPSIDLTTFIEQNDLIHGEQNIFIKIDCQGAEIPILKGATNILPVTDFILLEIPLFGQYNENTPNFLEHIQYMESIGFIPYDIVEKHYMNDFNMQIDMLFISKKHPFNNVVQESLYRNIVFSS